MVIDNGAATCKAGFAGERDPVKVLPNYTSRAKGIKRQFVADEVDECEDIQVSHRICGRRDGRIDKQSTLLLTKPVFVSTQHAGSPICLVAYGGCTAEAEK